MVFPSLKAKRLVRILKRRPLCYEIVGTNGSHRKFESRAGFPPIDFAFHDKDEVPPGLVRQVLVKRVGLSESQARDLI